MIKILFLSANPSKTRKLPVDKEYNAIRDSVKQGHYGNRFYADQVNQVSIQKLHQYILELDDDDCFISKGFSINCLIKFSF
ncbi:MAG: hypothetical protein OER82_12985 [Nitrosopumilus sp.]|nr:hypothetical protein [Nitrosopumilus sp.]